MCDAAVESSATAAPADFKVIAKPAIPNNPANVLRLMRLKLASLRISSARPVRDFRDQTKNSLSAYSFNSSGRIGNRRILFPVAAKIAFTTAEAIGGVLGSPPPPGFSALGMM